MYRSVCCLFLITSLLLSGCATSSFKVENLAKSDLDMVADANIRAIHTLLKELTIKLYKRNPDQLKKVPNQTINKRLQELFNTNPSFVYSELKFNRSTDAMLLAFNPDYHGDRVFALMAGLISMLDDSYNNQQVFFFTSQLDQQKLYNSARNIEVLAWRLSHRLKQSGHPYLLTNSTSGTVNLSFERLLGKLIARQDMMATLVSQKTNRTINMVVHGIATTAFLPI